MKKKRKITPSAVWDLRSAEMRKSLITMLPAHSFGCIAKRKQMGYDGRPKKRWS